MRSIKKLVRSIVNLIKSFSCDTVNGIADGVDEGNVPKVLLNLVMLLSAAVLVILAGTICVKLVIKNLHIIIAAGFLAADRKSVV